MTYSLLAERNYIVLPTFTHDEIAVEAYCLWLDAGSPDGASDYFWFTAIDVLTRRAMFHDELDSL